MGRCPCSRPRKRKVDGRRGSLPPLCIKHVPRGGREVDGTKKRRVREGRTRRWKEEGERKRDKENERERERVRERERGRKGERKPTRLGGYVRIIILRYSHIYKSAI